MVKEKDRWTEPGSTQHVPGVDDGRFLIVQDQRSKEEKAVCAGRWMNRKAAETCAVVCPLKERIEKAKVEKQQVPSRSKHTTFIFSLLPEDGDQPQLSVVYAIVEDKWDQSWMARWV
jgi:hypothetical protein